MINWNNYPNFSANELRCKETGEIAMDVDFMDRLQALRTEFGKRMPITSGYRSAKHSVERNKAKPGTHTQGKAVDVAVMGEDALELVRLALSYGFTGIGISQKAGGARFVHLDTAPRKAIWSY